MTDTITIAGTVITPHLVMGYEAARQGGTLVHPILGRASADITLRPAGLRTGTLRLLFTGSTADADSLAAATAHAASSVAVLASGDLASVAMSYVVPDTGRIVRTLDDETRAAWTVAVDFQEVAT